MKPYVQEAEVLRLLLSHGCISGEKIIAWADETIMAEKEMDNHVLDLCTESPEKTPALLSRLSDIATGADKFAAMRTALGRMYDVVANDSPEDLAGFWANLGNIAGENKYQLPEDLRFLNTLNEEKADLSVKNKALLQHLKHFKDLGAN